MYLCSPEWPLPLTQERSMLGAMASMPLGASACACTSLPLVHLSLASITRPDPLKGLWFGGAGRINFFLAD